MATSETLRDLRRPEGARRVASNAMRLLREIYPLCRSITGDGVRETIDLLAQHAPLERYEIPSGTSVFDWEIPKEWNVREAYICNASGERVLDFGNHALHLMGYSTPVRKRMTLEELRPHLHSLPDHPDWIPYRTSYWRENWGFCLTQRQLDALPQGLYDVVIDASLKPGSLTYAECRIQGETNEEFLIFTHICHPALANDNASGLAVATHLAHELSSETLHLSYRFVFAPATIGSIAWLAKNEASARRLRGGLVIGLLGDPGPLTYKRTRKGNTEIDYVAVCATRASDPDARVAEFSPYGYDERQFCSPGFNLPIGRLTRSPNGAYPAYHTSADNLGLMTLDSLANSIQAIARIINRIDSNQLFRRRAPDCEPRLGKYGLFRSTGGGSPQEFDYAILWLLNQCDGTHGINDVADAAGLSDDLMRSAADALLNAGLIEEVTTIPISSPIAQRLTCA